MRENNITRENISTAQLIGFFFCNINELSFVKAILTQINTSNHRYTLGNEVLGLNPRPIFYSSSG